MLRNLFPLRQFGLKLGKTNIHNSHPTEGLTEKNTTKNYYSSCKEHVNLFPRGEVIFGEY